MERSGERAAPLVMQPLHIAVAVLEKVAPTVLLFSKPRMEHGEKGQPFLCSSFPIHFLESG